ncbi:hypothetical protein QTP88_007626 [Uroleucon formosanum]
MQSTCAKSQEKLKHDEDILERSICKDITHFYCVGYSEQNFKKIKSPKSNAAEKNVGSSMEKNIEELMKSVSFMSAQLDNFSNKLDNKIVTENKLLSKEVVILKSKIDEIEHYNLGISVNITGIPKTQNENSYRINTYISKRSLIVAKLATLEMKINLIRNVKSNKLTTDKMSNGWPKENIYMNERLTKLRRTLFYQTKIATTTKNYKFIWVSNGDILMRKNENSKILKIKSSQDINTL